MVDVICFDDLDLFGRELNDPLEELRQDLYHRGIEPPGSNIDDSDRGLGLDGSLNGPVDRGLKHQIEAEFRKDDRVDAVNAEITEVDESSYRVAIEVEPGGGLELQVGPTGVTVIQ